MDWMRTRFPGLPQGYESFYLRAVDPLRPRSLWLRHTVHKPPGGPPVGQVWLTLFGADAPAPVTRKWAVPEPRPGEGLGLSAGRFGPESAQGSLGDATWDIRWTAQDAPLAHLPAAWLYRTPVPRTKPMSPVPSGTFSGTVGAGNVEWTLDGWAGMVGHNWGTEHAERWIWLHGTAFPEAPEAWLDLAVGRVRIGGRTTPWIANGAVSLGGRRHRIGGPLRRARVVEDPLRLDLEVRGEGGVHLEATVHSRRSQTVVWRYADPDGSEHHVANCSVADVDLVVAPPGGVAAHVRTKHGGAYELGMREADHGLPLQPYADPARPAS